ncbi:MAG: hypothetical protein CSA66_01380 [Proteobacteria bacterium]|nr:MAG: hypothetical protein CSA66_01380 [Pseudomonadota bacterium]
MPDVFDILFLLALPASGKSEVRNYLTHKDPLSFHMGPTVQLDDYPYVHLQLIVDEILEKLGQPRVYHWADDQGRNGPYMDPAELGGLIELLNDDFAELRAGVPERPDNPAARLLERFDAASVRAGGRAKFLTMPAPLRARLEQALMPEAKAFFDDKAANFPADLDGKTIVVEFARGGPKTDELPLAEGYGYKDSLKFLDPDVLDRAAILYIWVTPEESRRKNIARAAGHGAAGDGSILFHRTPDSVLDTEYGMCDMAWLVEQSAIPGTIRVERDGRTWDVPTERFDNREDLTSFLRADVGDWSQGDIDRIHTSIHAAADRLWETWSARRGT